MKLPKIGVNFYKVGAGVVFSLLWARVMYVFWPQPSFITFIWFYIIIGSVLLKWVVFEIIDQVRLRRNIKTVKEELNKAEMRVSQTEFQYPERDQLETGKTVQASLNSLENEVMSLGQMVESALQRAVKSVTERDLQLAAQVIEYDHQIDNEYFKIQNNCIQLISPGRKETIDPRMIVLILSIITELERMGDYAEGIAKITLMIGKSPPLQPLALIPQMAQKAVEMIRGSLEAFRNKDVAKAIQVCQQDDEVDALYDQFFKELILFMIEHPETITRSTRLIWIAHNLERCADRATNISEQTAYIVTGKVLDVKASKY